MSAYLRIILYIGINILTVHISNNILGVFLEPKEDGECISKSKCYTICLMLGIFTYFNININMISPIVLIYITSINFSRSIKHKVSVILGWTIFIVFLRILISAIYTLILNSLDDIVVFDEISNQIETVIYMLIMSVIVKITCLYKMDFRLSKVVDSIYMCVTPLCCVVILYFFNKIYIVYKVNYYIIIVCILIISIDIFFFILLDRIIIEEHARCEYRVLKKQLEYYILLEENINDTFEKIRTIKHDLKYQLLYLKAKTEENTEQALVEINERLDLLIEEVLSDKCVEYTKNKKLNRLLNYKLFSVYEKGIPFDIKVNIREDTFIDESCLYTVLGNAIDNAVDNFDNSKSELDKIIIRILEDCGNLYIKIKNPFLKDLNFKNGIPLTSKPDKVFHGIGLKSIKRLVENKNGYFNISVADNIFTLEILLYDEIKEIEK